jgi:hypothetical protein
LLPAPNGDPKAALIMPADPRELDSGMDAQNTTALRARHQVESNRLSRSGDSELTTTNPTNFQPFAAGD